MSSSAAKYSQLAPRSGFVELVNDDKSEGDVEQEAADPIKKKQNNWVSIVKPNAPLIISTAKINTLLPDESLGSPIIGPTTPLHPDLEERRRRKSSLSVAQLKVQEIATPHVLCVDTTA
eukprot:TRINITY_DN14112_c0_g1_i2.p1 TRINITY_DN14112_c0_g1~~TRINITY_DN14112_c0_g1_i2.p1  ORF type:complete len:131 (+),score=19.53 TRINITY_DN14112_c0_g1_i2:37-393(+)